MFCRSQRGPQCRHEADHADFSSSSPMLFSARLTSEQSRVLNLMAHAGEIGAKCGTSDLVQICRQRALRRIRNGRLQRCKRPLTIGLAERHESHACRDKVSGHGMKKCDEGQLSGNTMARAGDTDRNRISDRAVPKRQQAIECMARPCGARGIDEGAALSRRLEMPFP